MSTTSCVVHRNHKPIASICLALLTGCFLSGNARGQTMRQAPSLESQLMSADTARLVQEVESRGDARRGALIFYKSAAACAVCHLSDGSSSPLGPDLSQLGVLTTEHVIESLLHPSKSIRKGYETCSLLMADGKVVNGLITKQTEESIELREATSLGESTSISMDDVEAIRKSKQSMMPERLVGSLPELRDFLDLAKYVSEVSRGGREAAQDLKPTPDQLVVKDDTKNLDHKRSSTDFAAETSTQAKRSITAIASTVMEPTETPRRCRRHALSELKS